ncbi:MAG: hypothetical protein ACLPPV_04840 [Candidatus Korobacteraceae bacterium]|jgi:hypothetical protein
MNDFCGAQLFRRNESRTKLYFLTAALGVLWLGLILACPSAAQTPAQTTGDTAALQELQSQVHELKDMVLQLQQQTVASRAEITRLREELEVQHNAAENATVDEQSPAYGAPTTAQLDQRLDHLEEDQQLLAGKIDDQYQTKVESASKYRVRLSGLVLFNLFGNSGTVDNQDVPTWAEPPNPGGPSGSVGGTLRQSIIGLETFGPDVWGARTSASINFDFGGGFPGTDNGVNDGLVQLRTAAVRLDWKTTSVIAGQDQLFLSPLSSTSFASVIVPPLSYAGNLWAWTPQLRVEHRFALSGDSTIKLTGGFLDPLTGELPGGGYYTWYRTPTAGEQSRQPGYAARVAYSHPFFGQTFTVGAGGYYSRQNWDYDRIVNGWAGTLDANLPLGRRFVLSSEFYRGAAIGGLGAALGRSVLFNGMLSTPSTEVDPLNVVGGWGQLKFRATPKLEFNAAFGQDSPFASEVRYFGEEVNSYSYASPYLTANRGAFGNVIYWPRSDLLLSMEYRRLRTFTIYDNSYQADQVNMSVGVLF